MSIFFFQNRFFCLDCCSLRNNVNCETSKTNEKRKRFLSSHTKHYINIIMMSFVSRVSFLFCLVVSVVAGFGIVVPSALATRHTTSSSSSSCRGTALFMANIQKGTVKWFNTQKGFGFITPDDGSADIFVHQTSVQMEGFRSLADGESVEFVVETDGTGRKKAISVTGPDGADVQGAPFQPSNDYNRY